MKYIVVLLVLLSSLNVTGFAADKDKPVLTSSVFAEPAKNLIITVHDGSQSKDVVYKMAKFIGFDVTLPIVFNGKHCVLDMIIECDQEKSKQIRINVWDGSVILPGTAGSPVNSSSPSTAQIILCGSFPYTFERFPVFTSDEWSLSAQITEDKQ